MANLLLLFALPSSVSAGTGKRSWRTNLPAVKRIVSNPQPGGGVDERLPLTVLATYREQVVGCHSWERFLDQRWPTYFVFDSPFVAMWRFDAWVRSADTGRVSAGVHLLELEEPPGDMSARAVTLAHLRRTSTFTPYLFSVECAIHSLPMQHPQFRPFQQIITALLASFMTDERHRQSHAGSRMEDLQEDISGVITRSNGGPPSCGRSLVARAKRRFRPLLSMTAVILEHVPTDEPIENASYWTKSTKIPGTPRPGGAIFHGADVGAYASRHAVRPADAPWISDTTAWIEDHIQIYNSSMLETVVTRLHDIGPVYQNFVRAGSHLLCIYGWAAARNNEVHTFLDRGWPLTMHSSARPPVQLLDRSVYNAMAVPYAELETLNLNLYADVWSPQSCLRESVFTMHVLKIPVDNWCPIDQCSCHAAPHSLIPRAVSGAATAQRTWEATARSGKMAHCAAPM
jgi:hypothetical protein